MLASQCSAVGDDDVKVAERVVSAVHILGFHTPPKKWLPLVLKALTNSKSSQAQVLTTKPLHKILYRHFSLLLIYTKFMRPEG